MAWNAPANTSAADTAMTARRRDVLEDKSTAAAPCLASLPSRRRGDVALAGCARGDLIRCCTRVRTAHAQRAQATPDRDQGGALADRVLTEEQCDLAARRLRRVGAVHQVLADLQGEVAAHRAGRRRHRV